ncbi:MAG: hypothetical protein V4527_14575 [Pseudomonadota bacterium]
MPPDSGTPYEPSLYARGGYSLGDILHAARQGRSTGLVVIISITLLAVIFLALAKPQYTAEILITEKINNNDASAARSALSLIGGLAGGAGAAPTEFKLFGDLINSNALARVLDQKYGMVQVIFADQWDQHDHIWIKPTGPIATIKAGIKSLLNMPPWTPPDSRDLARYLVSNVHMISENVSFLTASSTYSLRYSNTNPQFAAYFLSLVNREADNILRQRHDAELQKNIQYLQRRLLQTTEVGYREALIQLVADQEKQLMMLRGDASYAAEVVDPAVAPKVPSFPNVKLTLILVLILGSFFSILSSIAHGLFWPSARPWSIKHLGKIWSRATVSRDQPAPRGQSPR